MYHISIPSMAGHTLVVSVPTVVTESQPPETNLYPYVPIQNAPHFVDSSDEGYHMTDVMLYTARMINTSSCVGSRNFLCLSAKSSQRGHGVTSDQMEVSWGARVLFNLA